MSLPVPSSSLAVSLSTRRTLLPASVVQQVATLAGVDGLDVDATSALGAWQAARLAASDDTHIPIRTVWMPAGELQSTRGRVLVETVVKRQPDAHPRVIATLAAGATLYELIRLLELGGWPSQSLPVTLGLQSTALKGGRPHLVQLGVIRRFAEEWNLSVAVDLSGQFDPTWEAEAAVARLGERLTVLRINASAPSRAAVGRDRVACRALHAAMDQDRFLDVAVAPVKSVPFPITPRVASSGTRRAVDYVAERSLLHARDLREGISHFEGSRSSQGI